MKKTLLVGRHGVGKTTLKQALRGEEIRYVKTQYIDYGDWLIDSPGEYAEVHGLSAALAIYSYEADIVALLISADDDYSLFHLGFSGVPAQRTVLPQEDYLQSQHQPGSSSPSASRQQLPLPIDRS